MEHLKEIKIISILPCIAMPERIRIVAELDCDISEILPYLNTIIDGAIYNHPGHNISMKKEDRMIGITGRQFAAGKVVDMKDAEELIVWFKNLVNDTYEKKDSIVPNYERRKQLTALDIYKLLPQTNCKKCEEQTCLAFAVKLAAESKSIMVCADLFSGQFTDKRTELIRLLQSCGYKVPAVFAEKGDDDKMKIEIFGPGCAKCNSLEKLVKNAVQELGLTAEVVKVKEINEMVNRGVMFTPALFVDGKKKSEGKVPTIDEIKKYLQEVTS